ncbi:MAG: hypothetical protein WBP45_11035 [Daejeonella sp.]
MDKNKKQENPAKVAETTMKPEKKEHLQVIKPGEEPTAIETTFTQVGPSTKPALNLDQTVQVVIDLGRKIKKTQNLKTQASLLEEFEIKNEDGYFAHELSIEDSNRKSFETKDAVLIKDVIQFIRKRIAETVTELEANIILPQ